MEVEFDTRFKHPFSMIVAGSSGSGKTVFTKQVLHSADVEFERIFLVLFGMARRIPRLRRREVCVRHAHFSGRVPRVDRRSKTRGI